MSACHDAIRKAVTAHMAAAGLRARSGEGAHRIVLDYARHQLATVLNVQLLADAELIRRDRAVAEYGDFASKKYPADHIRWAASVAEQVVNAVAANLASTKQPDRPQPR